MFEIHEQCVSEMICIVKFLRMEKIKNNRNAECLSARIKARGNDSKG